MKNCPYCNASLPEETSFCVYCMRELAEKTAPPPLRRKKRLWLPTLILALGLSAACIVGVLLLGHKNEAPDAIGEADAAHVALYADEETFRIKGEQTAEAMPYCGAPVWRPAEMTKAEETEGWVVYECPGVFASCDPRIAFKKDGTDVLVILDDLALTEQAAAEKLLENLGAFICDKGFFDLYGYIDSIRPDGTPGSGWEQFDSHYSLPEALGAGSDPCQDVQDASPSYPGIYRSVRVEAWDEECRFFYAERTRSVNGENRLDFWFYFTFGDWYLP